MRVGLFLILLILPLAALADPVRVASFNTSLSRKGPGLMLRDILKGDPQALAAAAMVDATRADVIVLQDIDYDLEGIGLSAFADLLATDYPHRLARRPNSGMATGLDLDGDGRLGGAGDAQGFGFFAGDGGTAVLSRHPILTDQVRDFSDLLWADQPDALLFDGMTAEAKRVQRLSSVAHWEVPVQLPSGTVLRLLTFHATPPVFDGPEDRNGRRNHDELVFWANLIEGRLPFDPPAPPFVVLGDANADPEDGDGLADGILRLLHHPTLTDPRPQGSIRDGNTRGDPALHTAQYDRTGGLRLDYVLPMAGLAVLGAGLTEAEEARDASSHWPVWVDLDL
ncbi:endonuclease/exonuclease/phosphatase family protein [Falsirhodobacter deserti]|uniref:endonuclease/exonuclease/phosphatase family protein n=1 Tax=Falsirhodobacter deserti TaxID=1365611 RepID=UPI0019D48D15|nr:endonuclease/exonuclease/phosphatase family protein [Falsirhodobacter deserti]